MKPVEAWVEAVARRTQPDRVHWCDGSEAEYRELIAGMERDGELIALAPDAFPGCYLHRSQPNDVARTEQSTFICSAREEDAGPTNNWWDPAQARATLDDRFRGSMRERTLYVVPYLMGPPGSPV